MEQPNVGSTHQTPSTPSGSLTPVALPESEAVAAKRSLRRKLLIGGAVTGGLITLPNTAVLAKKKQKCTVSTIQSQNASVVVQTPCGDSPGCWRNNAFSTWNDGAHFTINGVSQSVTPTHSTTFQTYASDTGVTFPITFSTSNPASGAPPTFFLQSGSKSASQPFSTLINQMSGFSLKISYTTTSTPHTTLTYTVLNQGQLANLISALLNSFFFGPYYVVSGAPTVIKNFLTSVVTAATSNTDATTAINNLVNPLFGSGGTIIAANNNFSELCPP